MPDFSEIGMTGLRHSGGYVQEEWLRDLRSRPWKTYREMWENDAVIGSTGYAITTLMRRTERHLEPEDANSREDAAAAEFVERCLDRLARPWSQTFEEILSFLPYGWSATEEVFERQEDGAIGWKKLALRSQDSLTRWSLADNGDLLGLYQSAAPTYREVFIPVEKLLHFTAGAYKGNPEGRSLLRRAYRAWYFGKNIEEREAIGIERELCGLPAVGVPAEWTMATATTDHKAGFEAAKKLATDVRLNAEGGLVYPMIYDKNGNQTFKIDLLSTGGRRAIDTDKVISRYDQRKAMTVLADFILLGHENVGSLALGVSKAELFATSIEAHLGDVADVLNRVAIPRLLALNGMKGRCRMRFGQADRVDLAELGAFISDVGGVSVLLDDDDLTRALRRMAKLPEEVKLTPEQMTDRELRLAQVAAASLPPPEETELKKLATASVNGHDLVYIDGAWRPLAKTVRKRSFPVAARTSSRERVAKDDDDLKGDAGALDAAVRIADHLAPNVRARFLEAVAALAGKVDMVALEAAILAGDFEAVAEALAVDELAVELEPLLAETGTIVARAGAAVTAALGTELNAALAFDVANPRLATWMAEHGAELVTAITEQQRAAISERLTAMVEEGRQPAAAAKDLLPHLGQSERDSRAVASFRQRLVEAGETDGVVESRTARYARRKLEDRAQTIAEHEALEAAGAARHESWTQAVDAGHLPDSVRRRVLVAEDACPVCTPLGAADLTFGLDEDIVPGKRHAPFHVKCRCGERLEISRSP